MTVNIYDFYKKYYDLKKIDLHISKKKFALLIYDEEYNYYFENNHFVELDKIDNMLDAIDSLKEKYNLKVIIFYPLCYCDNTLIICCRINSRDKNSLDAINYQNLDEKKFSLIDFHMKEDITLYVSSTVKNEIHISQKNLIRYKIHEKFIKRYILTKKKRKKEEFYELLNELMPNKKSIIDISCGDCRDMFLVAKKKKYDVIVGNDICINYLYAHKDLNIIYTSDNIEQNYIADKAYDVAFCKNTLHHMNDIVCIKNLLDFMKRISNEIILIEIMDPNVTGGLPRFLNKYLYGKFLNDAGKCYLNENQFMSIINNKFSGYSIEFKKFKNVLGEYMIAKITKK